uniref:Uncharacterized protein n=1 Tax=Zooxanthella nutricula TaxID=1333877 RepID=A0A7S2LZC6_9DINO
MFFPPTFSGGAAPPLPSGSLGSVSSGSLASSPTTRPQVTVIAPGAGTQCNALVYKELGLSPEFKVEIVGQSRAPYDRYPAQWPEGCQEPNLESFSRKVVENRVIDQSKWLILGSRGGQVVLPCLWEVYNDGIPPAIVVNGGCAMALPRRDGRAPPAWPERAVTFLLLGGQDYFKAGCEQEYNARYANSREAPPFDYVRYTRKHAPKTNRTTAILYVAEMEHMPQAPLLALVLPHALRALANWERLSWGDEHFRALQETLHRAGCWNGQVSFTTETGAWKNLPFGRSAACTNFARAGA